MSTTATVAAGYIKTEIGVLPKDWKVETLGDVCIFENGDRSSNYPADISRSSSGIPFVNAGHVERGNIKRNKLNYISRESYNRLGGGKFKPGDILYCIRGSLGKFGLVPSDIPEGAIASSMVIVRSRPHKVTSDFLCSYFQSYLCEQMIEKWGGGAAQPNLGAQQMEKFSIALPPSEIEQESIASTLSDVDNLIGNLEKLLTKKKALKQATMQELLTGKRRLSGFSGEWLSGVLNDVVNKISTGLNPRQNFVLGQGNNFYVTIKNFWNGKLHLDDRCDRVTDESLAMINNRSNLEVGDILFASIGTEPSTFLIKEKPKNWNINESVFSIKPNKKMVDPMFLEFLLVADWNFRILNRASTGSTFQSIKIKQLKNLSLKYPCLDEQKKIASILSDIGSEIEKFECKLNKLKLLKQGMMQALLTGKIRLLK